MKKNVLALVNMIFLTMFVSHFWPPGGSIYPWDLLATAGDHCSLLHMREEYNHVQKELVKNVVKIAKNLPYHECVPE